MTPGQQPQPFKRCPGTVRNFAARTRKTAPPARLLQNSTAKNQRHAMQLAETDTLSTNQARRPVAIGCWRNEQSP